MEALALVGTGAVAVAWGAYRASAPWLAAGWIAVTVGSVVWLVT